ncbi:hypothetical protein KM1_083850 [Entamoeba histolytica HM-3:IMSS]|uniref:Importin alpha n=4 Tax=Entamoeba histolytica TaxID=5759 RepID=C4LUJ8_ENTH1|nr:hypothetical protein EHI_022850 [Entamoeba histolytica HM-1:IMSS]EAL48093.1 hypothetical protein EHI_022850 [Entamoeba histolytica HM-1:IMSS]EMD44376.1 Hypothetical protein EHI5A_161010 [Entamoeba histolytica KU27]EMS11211.1 hypothetical protein KM1_083850 [Entamoeba histolytica HM-3:IMSS]GAT92295.1 hypothetical protein CL6EHI_022850 [Entamoeba histolytica]|eukprot:XP_653479.1 hypothetical protein EHI_022850 [Entamoeba histolytica HM-1:IMSS]
MSNLRDTIEIDSELKRREKGIAELRKSRRERRLEVKRIQGTNSLPDIPLQQTLPMLKQENVSEAIDLISTHLFYSKFSDVYYVYNCIDLIFIHLQGSEEVVFKILKLLTNIASIDGSFDYLLKVDHTFIIRNLLLSQNSNIRTQTAWYLSNLILDNDCVYPVFKKMGLLDSLQTGLQLYYQDIGYCQKIGFLIGAIAKYCDESNNECSIKSDNMEVELTQKTNQITTVEFKQSISPTNSIYEDIFPLLSLLYPRIESINTTYFILSMLSQIEINFKKLAKSIPTLYKTISSGLNSKSQWTRNYCIAICVNISDFNQKYMTRLMQQSDFFRNLSQTVYLSSPSLFVDLCYVCSNMIAMNQSVTPVLLQVNLVQRMIQKLSNFDFSENTDSIVDIKIEFGWFYLNVLSTSPIHQIALIISNNLTFKALTIMAECLIQNSKEFISTFIDSVTKIITELLHDDSELAKNFIDILEESGVTENLHKIEYSSDEHTIALNKYFYVIDHNNHLEDK